MIKLPFELWPHQEDEAVTEMMEARMSEWPTKAGRVFVSTPCGENTLYKLLVEAQDETT